MQLDELKLITASNLINLRSSAGMTQAELGAMLNYSDKTISKWERAEAIPDAYVLKQIGEIFHVSVDSLLSSHDEWKPIPVDEPETEQVSYSTSRIIGVAITGIWTLALTVFVALWLAGIIFWQSFVIAGLVLSLFIAGYLLCYPRYNPWQVFLILIPAEIIVFLSCNLRVAPPKKLHVKRNTNREEDKRNG